MSLLKFFKSKVTRGISTRTELLNHLIATRGYRNYLEIGVRDRRHNFDKIKAPGVKHGCDPAPLRTISHVMTSDAFFAQHAKLGGKPYDLVFIDGLHIADQVERDIVNALDHLTPDGTVVLHDCNPLTADAQTDDYDGKKHWNGTVWKAIVKRRATRDDLAMWVLDMDEGCGMVRRGTQTKLVVPTTDYAALDYAYLAKERAAALNLRPVAELERLMQGLA